VQTKATSDQALREVVRWRREQLAESGFSRSLAGKIAEDPRFDLHALIELVERGCPPQLALRIFAPLDEESVTWASST
jgi:hypothetical protein